MPVFLDKPWSIASRDLNVRLQSLKKYVPANGAVAMMYYVNDSSQGNPGRYLCVDYWYPGMSDLPVLSAVGWGMSAYSKEFFLVNLGPEGSNPEKYVYTGVYYGIPTPTVHLVGYFTYDEIQMFPEVASPDRSDYEIPINDWLPSPNSTFQEANIWDIPYFRQYGAKPPTAVVFDGTYSSIVVNPRQADPDHLLSENYAVPYSNIAGFDSNGDVWASRLGGSTFAVIGYLTVPITWSLGGGKYERTADLWSSDAEYRPSYPGNAGTALFTIRYSMQGWSVRGTEPYWSNPPHGVVPDAYSRSRSVIPVPLDVNSGNEIILYSSATDETRLKSCVFLAYLGRYMDVTGFSMFDVDDIALTGPDLYYPPDNFGSLHINYTIEGQEGTYKRIVNMAMHLSGGNSNTDPSLSLGSNISFTELIPGINSLFPDATLLDAYTGADTYRCLYLRNKSTKEDAAGIRIWISKDNLANGNKIYIGADPSGINSIAQSVSSENVEPTGVDFVLATSEDTCYTLPMLTQNDFIPIWFKRDFVDYAQSQETPDDVSIHISILNNKG